MIYTHLGIDPFPDLETKEHNGGRWYKLPSGTWVPSVTTVLGYKKKVHLEKWKNKVGEDEATYVKNRAGTRGKAFHSLMEGYLNNKPVLNLLDGVMPDMQEHFRLLQKHLHKIDRIHHMEECLYSEYLGIAGRVDVIAEYNGIPSVIDFKTSRKPKKEEWVEDYFIQASTYAHMYEAMTDHPLDQIVIMMAVDHDFPQVWIKEKKEMVGYIDQMHTKLKDFLDDQ